MVTQKNLMLTEAIGKKSHIQKKLGDEWLVFAAIGSGDQRIPITVNNTQVWLSIPDLEQPSGFSKQPLTTSIEHLNIIKDTIKNQINGRIVFATDGDSDGEAIAEFLRQQLDLGDNYERIHLPFYTKDEIDKHLQNTKKIDPMLIAEKYPKK